MECCDNHENHGNSKGSEDKNETIKNHSPESQIKGGEIKMNKRMVLWIAISILFLAVIYLTFKVNTLDLNAVQLAGAAVQGAASSIAMVGGC
mgnify:CR=1 FL=1